MAEEEAAREEAAETEAEQEEGTEEAIDELEAAIEAELAALGEMLDERDNTIRDLQSELERERSGSHERSTEAEPGPSTEEPVAISVVERQPESSHWFFRRLGDKRIH